MSSTLRLKFQFFIQNKEFRKDDYHRRIQICEIMTETILENVTSLKTFALVKKQLPFLHAFVNKHNCRYYWLNASSPEPCNVSPLLGVEITPRRGY